jgi:hypothetical protein
VTVKKDFLMKIKLFVANVIIVVKVALSFRSVLNVLKILSEKILHPVYVKLGIMKIYKAIK